MWVFFSQKWRGYHGNHWLAFLSIMWFFKLSQIFIKIVLKLSECQTCVHFFWSLLSSWPFCNFLLNKSCKTYPGQQAPKTSNWFILIAYLKFLDICGLKYVINWSPGWYNKQRVKGKTNAYSACSYAECHSAECCSTM